MKVAWPIRSVIAGTAGTAALSLSYALERRLRPRHRGPLDYDDSIVPGEIVASIMHLPHVTAREDEDLGLLLRWSYGSVFGLWHGLLRRSVPGALGERDLWRHADDAPPSRCSRCSGGRRRRGAGRPM